MHDLGWRAEGIERARAAGGIDLEVYRRPGFTGGLGVRRVGGDGAGSGLFVSWTDEGATLDDRRELPQRARRARG